MTLTDVLAAPFRFLAPPRKRTHQIAVIGLFDSGKTVLTTALINHLQAHNAITLPLKDGDSKVEIDFIESTTLPAWLGKHSEFPYRRYRGDISAKWPKKTLEMAAYACSFYRNNRECSLLIVDVPGERYGDFTMVRRTYAEWSKYLLDDVFTGRDYEKETVSYRDLVKGNPKLDVAALLESYRHTLANLFRSYRPIITPSTFLLTHGSGTNSDTTTRYFGREIREDKLTDCTLGTKAETQFVPLPESYKSSQADIYRRFESNYETYRKEVVTPIRKAIERSSHLVVLVDITGLLAANTARKNGAVAIATELFSAVRPGRTLLQRFRDETSSYFRSGRLNGSGIRRVTFVATKADKVLRNQHANMKKLLEKMMERVIKPHMRAKSLDVQYVAVSAMAASGQLESDPTKKTGVPLGRQQKEVFTPSDVPDEWPAAWEEGRFNFPDVEPRFPADEQQAPAHIDMELFVQRVLELS